MSRHKSSQWVLRLNRNVRDWSSDASFHDRTLEKLVCLDRENETHEETFAAILLSIINEQSVKKWAKDVAREFLISKPNRRSIKWYPDGNGCVISVFNPNGADKDFRFEDQDASSGVALKEVTLLDHMKAVSQEAQTLATNIGIPDNLVQGCAIAALFHDLGKVDPRFQLLLRGGNRVALKEAKEPLAKSAARQWTRREFEVVQENSGYPRGTRHEVLSVALAQMYSQVREAPDPELVLGLISTHHGRCRPLVPVAAESPQLEVSFLFDGEKAVALASNASEHFSSEFCERFWNLIRRYGWWGHAFLELVVRLADQRVSREKRVE
jgi:CRISPR-associated endonuclease Cas3-HD